MKIVEDKFSKVLGNCQLEFGKILSFSDMSEQKTDNAILDDTKVSFSAVQQQKKNDSSFVAKSEYEDSMSSNIKSSGNVRKNTVISNNSTSSSLQNAITSGPSTMEDEDATTTTIAIGNNTYTIGEIKCPTGNCYHRKTWYLQEILNVKKWFKSHSCFAFLSLENIYRWKHA